MYKQGGLSEPPYIYSKFFNLILSYHGLSHLIFVCTYGHFYYLIKDTWLQHGSSMAWQT